MLKLADRIPQTDLATGMIEVVGRVGRWIIETAFLCILGFLLLGGLGTITVIVASFTSFDPKALVRWMPAAGWWIGLAIGLLRLVSVLRKPFGSPVDPEDDADRGTPQSDATEPAAPASALVAAPSILARLKRSLQSLAVGSLLGALIGLFLSVYFCVVATAAILSPVAPASWTGKMQIEAQNHDDGTDSQQRSKQSSGTQVGTGARFWHPVYGTIVTVCVAGLSILLALLGAIFGWREPATD